MQLLERSSQLEELEDLRRLAVAGSGALAVVGGEAGSGKTSLVQQFAGDTRPVSRVMIGACDSLSTPRPLGPLLDVASSFGASVQRLLRDSERRAELFTAVLDELTVGEPTLFVIEDVHWADEATLDLLRYLGRRIDGTRALLVVTYRNDEVSSRHPLQIVLGDLATHKSVRRISVSLLSKKAVAALCQGTLLDAQELHRRTGGNPFYVTEVIASNAQDIPATVRDAVLTRAARLSPTARDTLDAAAVIGDRVDPWLLEAIVGDAAHAVDECLASGLLRTVDVQLQFRHQLAQQAVLDAISPIRLSQLHARVLESLRSRPSLGNDLATLSHHAEAAGDRAAVLEYAPAAAARASGLAAHREAAAQYARALRFADQVSIDERESLLEGWLRETFATGQISDTIEACEKLLAIARSAHDGTKEAKWLTWLAWVLVHDGRNAEAEAASHRALELLEDLLPEHVHAFAYQIQARIRMLNRDYAQAISWGERAIELAGSAQDKQVLVGAINAVGSSRLVGGDERRGRADLEEGLAIAREAGLDVDVASLLTNLGSGHGEIYMLEHADRYLREGLDFTKERDLDGWRWYIVAWLALVRHLQGRWSEATDLAESVVRTPAADAIARMMALVALGRVRTRRGDPESGAVLDEALALAGPTETLQRLAPVHAARAEAAWLAGDVATAAAEARIPYDLALEHNHSWFLGELAYWRWKAGELGEVPAGIAVPFALQIEGDWAGASTRWNKLGCPYEAARALAEGDDEDALREAFAIFDRLGARPAAAFVTRRLRDLGIRSIPRGSRPATRSNPALLTQREQQVLELIATGRTNVEIASRLFLSPKTVEHHVTAILHKLDVSTRHEAVQAALDLGPGFQFGRRERPS